MVLDRACELCRSVGDFGYGTDAGMATDTGGILHRSPTHCPAVLFLSTGIGGAFGLCRMRIHGERSTTLPVGASLSGLGDGIWLQWRPYPDATSPHVPGTIGLSRQVLRRNR